MGSIQQAVDKHIGDHCAHPFERTISPGDFTFCVGPHKLSQDASRLANQAHRSVLCHQLKTIVLEGRTTESPVSELCGVATRKTML